MCIRDRISNNRRLNFLLGIELVQGITQNRREFNFDTRMRDDENKLDLLFGIKFGWTLPFEIGGRDREVFYVPGR